MIPPSDDGTTPTVLHRATIQPGTRVRWTVSDRLHCGIVQHVDYGGKGFIEVQEQGGVYRYPSPDLVEVCPPTPPFTCRHSVVEGWLCEQCVKNTSAVQ